MKTNSEMKRYTKPEIKEEMSRILKILSDDVKPMSLLQSEYAQYLEHLMALRHALVNYDEDTSLDVAYGIV